MDRLFAVRVISAENLEELNQRPGDGWSTNKSRQLLTLLHRSRHPRAFTELRSALCQEDSVKWLVNKLDELEIDDKLTQQSDETLSQPCSCLNCGHPRQSAAASTGHLCLFI